MQIPVAERSHVLSADEIAAFHREGYLVLPSFLDAGHIARLRPEVDDYATRGGYGHGGADRRPYEYPEHGLLISHPPLIAILEQLLGPGFAFHHLHSARHMPGDPGVPWHQDYEQVPQTNRSHIEIAAFFYLDGLNGEVGDLVLLPRSQRLVCEMSTFNVLGDIRLPGEVVVDDLPAGSLVLAHCALLHARRAKPGGRPRYFVDAAYCQSGIRWPSYDCIPDWRGMLRFCRERYGRGGRYDWLFDEERYFDQTEAAERLRSIARGSLIERLA